MTTASPPAPSSFTGNRPIGAYGGYPIYSAGKLLESFNQVGLNTAAFRGKANSFRLGLNATPGTGYLIMRRQDVLNLVDDAQYSLAIGIDRQIMPIDAFVTTVSPSNQWITLQNIVFVRATRLHGGTASDPDAFMLVEVSDKRYWLKNTFIDQQYNMRCISDSENPLYWTSTLKRLVTTTTTLAPGVTTTTTTTTTTSTTTTTTTNWCTAGTPIPTTTTTTLGPIPDCSGSTTTTTTTTTTTLSPPTPTTTTTSTTTTSTTTTTTCAPLCRPWTWRELLADIWAHMPVVLAGSAPTLPTEYDDVWDSTPERIPFTAMSALDAYCAAL